MATAQELLELRKRRRARVSTRRRSTGLDLSTIEGLREYADRAGLGDKATEILEGPKRLSILQRLGRGFSAFNPAEAILVGREKGGREGLLAYPKGILQGVGSAITGRNYGGERRYFRDVAEAYGIENGWAKGGLGFFGDVLLDPTTYFGGALARGVGLIGKTAGRVGLKGIGRVAPDAEMGLRMAGTALQDAAGRLFQLGYKSTPGAKEFLLTSLSKVQRAKLGLAGSNLNRLGPGTLTVAQQEELTLKLIAGKRAEFAAREAGLPAPALPTSADPLVQKTITEQAERTTKFSKLIGLEDPYETYFPFIKNTSLKKFLNETKGLQVGSEAYRKKFKNILTNEELELNPAKAFFTREAQIVGDKIIAADLQKFVDDFGKPLSAFKNSDEALQNGYVVLRNKGALGTELGYINKFDSALIRDLISPEFQSISMIAKATGFDALTALFKRSVTGLFLPFHVRNFVSGGIQNFEVLGIDVFNPANIAVGQKIAYLMGKGAKMPKGEVIMIGGKKMDFEDVMKPFVDRFSGDTFYTAEFEFALKKGQELKQTTGLFSKQSAKETAKTLGLGQDAIPFRVGRAVGQFIEHQQKAVAYVTALNKGYTIPQALKLAERAGFDYRALTRFESQIMRRIIPFYSFARKNIELQLRTAGENPQRINQILRFFGNFGDALSEEERIELPNFIRESLGIRLEDTPDGLRQYIANFGTPIEALAQLFEGNPVLRAISQMNPLIKAPVEIGIGKDTFRQRDLKDVYDAREYKNAPQILKTLLDITPVEKDVLDKRGDKLVKVGTRTQYVADPERLLIARSLFTSRGVSYLDQMFGGDLEGLAQVLKLTTGVKPTQIDYEATQAIEESKKRRELEDMLIKRTNLRRFQNVYERKD